MSDNQPKDEKSERRKRKKEKKEQEKREQEKREQEKREQDKKEQTKVKGQNRQNEEQPTSSTNTKPKQKKSRRVYYSAISASEDENSKFYDAKSSSEVFRDSMSRTDNEAERSVPQATAKPTNAPSEPLPSIPEDVSELNAQPETSKAIQTKINKKKKEEPAMTMADKEAERAEENTQKKQEEIKSEGKALETPTEKSPQKISEAVDQQKEVKQEIPKMAKIAEDTKHRPSKSKRSSKEQEKPIDDNSGNEREKAKRDSKDKMAKITEGTEHRPSKSKRSSKAQEKPIDNAENEREKTKRDSKDKTSEKAPLAAMIPLLNPAEESFDPTENYVAKKDFGKFRDLSDDDDYDEDSDNYEMYIEKMKAKRKKMSKSTSKGNHTPAEPWAYGERAYLGQGGVFVYMVIPPDGGYAWLVLLVSFLCQVIVDGIVLSLGIVLPYIAEDMGSSPSTTSLVASTQIGPITSAYINKYGFRPVALFGAIMSIFTILISTLSPNLTTLIIFYSIFGGMSLSMIWSSSQLIVGYYFERYRPIASGISCSGAGAGVLIFSYMNSQLAPEVGWRNTSRIHALFLVLILLIVLFYIEVQPTRIGRMLDNNLPDTETDSDETGLHSFFYSRITLHEPATMHRTSRSVQGNIFVQLESKSREPSCLNKCFQSCCPPFRRFMEQRMRVSGQDPDAKRVVIRQDPLDRQDIYYTGATEFEEFKLSSSLNELVHDQDNDMEIEILPVTNRRSESIHYNLTARHESLSRHSLRPHVTKAGKGSNAFLEFISPTHWVHPKVKRAFNMLFDLRLLAIMEFQVLLASAFFFPMGFNIPFVYSKVRAEMDNSYTNLISPAIGLSNFFFRIASGLVAFKFRGYTMAICGYGIVFGGVVTLVSSLYGKDVVWFQFIFAVCFAIAPAFYSTLRAIIYVQVLGLDKLTNAFGLTAMAMGAGVFIGTFAGGLLIELTGGYVATFAFSGACMILAGSLKLILPTLILWKHNRRTRKRTRFGKI